MRSKERLDEIVSAVNDLGYSGAAEKLRISRESVRRAVRESRGEGKQVDLGQSELAQFRQFCERFTPEERRAMLAGSQARPHDGRVPVVDFGSGDEVIIAFFTDTHWGAAHSPPEYWQSFVNTCQQRDVDMVLCAGDMMEGMSNRQDQVYQLTHVGWSAQMELARENLSMLSDFPVHVIDGNHDRWAIKAGGLYSVAEVVRGLDHVNLLGNDYGEIEINGTRWMLQHGEDGGGSYATSYRPQKIVEAISGGEKPSVLLLGHDHKQGYFFTRNVHVLQGGALCRQSAWMRSTRKANHDGFWIIRAGMDSGQILWMEPRWHPFY